MGQALLYRAQLPAALETPETSINSGKGALPTDCACNWELRGALGGSVGAQHREQLRGQQDVHNLLLQGCLCPPVVGREWWLPPATHPLLCPKQEPKQRWYL